MRIDRNDPQPWGICDYSGRRVLRSELTRQMEWRGNRLVWTGLMVWKRFADLPNPQNQTPMLKADPLGFADARPESAIAGQDWIVVQTRAGDATISDGETYFLSAGAAQFGTDTVIQWRAP